MHALPPPPPPPPPMRLTWANVKEGPEKEGKEEILRYDYTSAIGRHEGKAVLS